MSFDREHVLRQAAQVQPRRRPGVAGLLSGIHRSDELRGWITMESVALPPVPERTAAGWTLWSLIGVGNATPVGASCRSVPCGARSSGRGRPRTCCGT